MILAQALAHDLGALDVLFVVQQPHVVHGVKNAPMHRLQAVANIGQRAADDHRHRIVEIRPPHLVFNVDGLHVGGAGRAAVSSARRRQGELLIITIVRHNYQFLNSACSAGSAWRSRLSLDGQTRSMQHYIFSDLRACKHDPGIPLAA